MQGSSSWTPPTGTLGKIVAEAAQRVESLRARATELGQQAGENLPAASLRNALERADVAVIAEIKRKSPSKGWIKAGITAADQARLYETGGAAAISVLTEPLHFNGSPDDLIAVADAVSIPLLKKDFHIDTLQLLEARALGASAVLLIARALPPKELSRLMRDADRLCLETVVEVRDEDELNRAIDGGASIIGINNRNLETLEIDPHTSERLLPLIPRSIIAVAESGIGGRADVERVADWGADAVLVGSALSAAEDPLEAVRSLVGVARERGARGAGMAAGTTAPADAQGSRGAVNSHGG